jgi:branched-subunit amino acid ABC-type transport system permease component
VELLTNQVLAGIATGAIYACMALAVVMIYQAIDQLNFAQGELATFSTFLAYQLIQWGVPYWIAFALTLVLSFVGGVAIERILFNRLTKAPILAAKTRAGQNRRLDGAAACWCRAGRSNRCGRAESGPDYAVLRVRRRE